MDSTVWTWGSGLHAWFDRLFGIDLRSLAALRIGLGFLILCDLIGRLVDARAHYTEDGIMPLSALAFRYQFENHWWDQIGIHWPNYWSPFLWIETTAGAQWLLLLGIGLALMLIAGWQSRFAAFATWFFLVGVQNRNPVILHGGDQMLRMLAFWSMFLPLGARWSVDGAVATLKAYRQPAPTRTVSPATVALILQVCLIYWMTAALKTSREWHSENSALYYALSVDQYGMPIGHWMLNFPWLMKAATWCTIRFEWIGPIVALLATPKLRTLMVAAFWIFHIVMIGALMDVGPINYVSALLWMPFLPGSFWDAAARRIGRLPESVSSRLIHLSRTVTAWRNRRVARRVSCRVPLPQLRPSVMQGILAVLCFAYITCWNIWGVDKQHFPGLMPASWQWISFVGRVDQSWAMFAPRPMTNDGWFLLVAQMDDGAEIDLMRGGAPVSWDKPANVAAMYANARWCKFLMNLNDNLNAPQRVYYMNYMHERWVEEHPEMGPRIRRLSLYFMLETTPPPGSLQPPLQKIMLSTQVYEPAIIITPGGAAPGGQNALPANRTTPANPPGQVPMASGEVYVQRMASPNGKDMPGGSTSSSGH